MISTNQTNSTIIPPNNGNINAVSFKAISSVIIFVISLLGIFIPILTAKRFNLDVNNPESSFGKWIGALSCFAAGVFLSTGFMDILPHVQESLIEARKYIPFDEHYPFSSFFTLIGFFLVLVIEQSIAIYRHYNTNKTKKKSKTSPKNSVASSSIVEASSSTVKLTSEKELSSFIAHESQNNLANPGEILHRDVNAKEITLMSAMSIHAILEGLTIGLANTLQSVTGLTIVLGIHKGIVAISLGLNLLEDIEAIKLITILGLIFSIASPIGIFIGIGIIEGFSSASGDPGTLHFIVGVLDGLACGTFLYVVFMEILPHHLGHSNIDNRPLKLCSLILGFALICVFLNFH